MPLNLSLKDFLAPVTGVQKKKMFRVWGFGVWKAHRLPRRVDLPDRR